MQITIDEKTRIRGTEHCWQLERARIVKGAPEWRATKYFTTVALALQEAAQHEIRTTPATGLIEAIKVCEAVMEKYGRIFDDVGKFPREAE